jgi:hypothetical protein
MIPKTLFIASRKHGKTSQVMDLVCERMYREPGLQVSLVGPGASRLKMLYPADLQSRLLVKAGSTESFGPEVQFKCRWCGEQRPAQECRTCGFTWDLFRSDKNITYEYAPDGRQRGFEDVNGKRFYFEIHNDIRIDEADYGIDHLLDSNKT